MVSDRELVVEFAGLVVERLAPEEMSIFSDVTADYFAAEERVSDRRRRDESLGFGVDLALLTPYVLAVSGVVVQFLGSVATDLAKDATKPVAQNLVRRMFARLTGRPAQGDAIALNPAQLTGIRDASYRQALALGLPQDRAALLADAVVGNLHRNNR